MKKVVSVDAARLVFDIRRDLSVSARERKPGPPERIDGLTLGIITLERDSHEGRELHPDGDEILYVISGRLRVTGSSMPDEPVELGPGGACIVGKGEWHRVDVLEKTQLVHVTPGPNGDFREV